MPEIPVQTMVSISSEALLSALDVAIAEGSIPATMLANNLSQSSAIPLLRAVLNYFTHKEILDEMDNPHLLLDVVKEHFGIQEILTDEEIRAIQDEREIDINEILDDLDDDALLDHIEQHRSAKNFALALIESL